MDDNAPDLRLMTAEIVSAFVGSRNHVTAAELPTLIATVHAALSGLGAATEAAPVRQEPAVPLRKAVQPDAITCLFDGKAFKSLKRHLANEHAMSPAEYRTHWGLPKDSPMVAPNYAKSRSDLARSMGLGRKAATEVAPATGRDAPAPGDQTPPVKPKAARRKAG